MKGGKIGAFREKTVSYVAVFVVYISFFFETSQFQGLGSREYSGLNSTISLFAFEHYLFLKGLEQIYHFPALDKLLQCLYVVITTRKIKTVNAA